MKNSGIAIALIVAVVSSAALAAPKTYDAGSINQPGRYFNCLIAHQDGFREGPCWLG